MTHPFGLLRQRNIILQYYVEHSIFIIGQIECSWLLPHRQAICFSSLIWLSRNKSVKKSRFLRIVKNSREFSLLDLDLEAFWFHFSLLEKEWKHFDFTLHFSKKSESILISLCTSRKRVKGFLDALASLDLKLWVGELLIFLQLAHLRVFQIIFSSIFVRYIILSRILNQFWMMNHKIVVRTIYAYLSLSLSLSSSDDCLEKLAWYV
jgi:hypothetical protein